MSDVENEENTNQDKSGENEEIDNDNNDNNEEENNEEHEENNDVQEHSSRSYKKVNTNTNIKKVEKKPLSKKPIEGHWDNLYNLVRK